MFAAKNLSSYATYGLDPAAAAQKALSYWSDSYRTAADFGLWWTEKWLRTPTYFTAWAITRTVGATPVAVEPATAPNVIRIADVIEAATAAAVAPVEVAAAAPETVQAEPAAVEPVVPTVVEVVAESSAAAIQAAEQVVEAAQEATIEVSEDLTRLVGIGPKLAAALAERGVTRYAQIAAWTHDDLADIDRALDLKGRAVRDAWVAQAKRFAADS